LAGGLEDHHIAAMGLMREDAVGQQRHAEGQRIGGEAIGPLGRQQVVAIDQPGQHRSLGMVKGEKKKLRNTTTMTTSLMRKTKKFSSSLGFFASGALVCGLSGGLGGLLGAEEPWLAVSVMLMSMLPSLPCVNPS
jgi:hypothetical protein